MAVQWFPGHMHKARKEMAKVLPEIDVIVELLDARIPWSSENPMLGEMVQQVPLLRLLTKSDLADEKQTALWLQYLSEHPRQRAIATTTTDRQSFHAIQPYLEKLVDSRSTPLKPFVAMIIGIPNVGKSTLINTLTGRSIANTGNEPAITKQQQRITLNDRWVLRDTPGVLWPKVENHLSGYRLAAIGSIKDTAMDSAEVALHLLDYLRVAYPDLLFQRYGEDSPLHESTTLLEHIGYNRGCLGSGGFVDFDRAGRLLLQDFRQGLIGRITLETPEMKLREIQITERKIAEAAEKKAKRKLLRQTKKRKRKG